jgi:DNA-3-methyladenine glycosylase
VTPLPREFYNRPTLQVARDLLGKVLVHRASAGTTAGMIVEAEAYIGESDPACHAAPGPTLRNQPLYGEPGFAYVYLNYGVHYLFNVVTEPAGNPAAVLIRALEPLEGLDIMRKRRTMAGEGSGKGRMAQEAVRAVKDVDLCRGPGNLTRALGITLAQNRADLCRSQLFLEDRGLRPQEIAWSSRIGINVGTDRLWRAYVAGHPCVSGAAVRQPAREPSSLRQV